MPSFREALTPPVGGCLCAHCHGCMLLLPVVCIVLVFCVDGGFARCFFPLPKGRTVLLLMTSRSCSNSSLRFPFAAEVVCCLCCIHDTWGQSVTLKSGSPGSRLSALMPSVGCHFGYHPRDTQETSRKHPGATRGTQETPRKHPGDTQEPPRGTKSSRSHFQ